MVIGIYLVVATLNSKFSGGEGVVPHGSPFTSFLAQHVETANEYIRLLLSICCSLNPKGFRLDLVGVGTSALLVLPLLDRLTMVSILLNDNQPSHKKQRMPTWNWLLVTDILV